MFSTFFKRDDKSVPKIIFGDNYFASNHFVQKGRAIISAMAPYPIPHTPVTQDHLFITVYNKKSQVVVLIKMKRHKKQYLSFY